MLIDDGSNIANIIEEERNVDNVEQFLLIIYHHVLLISNTNCNKCYNSWNQKREHNWITTQIQKIMDDDNLLTSISLNKNFVGFVIL